MTFPMPTLLAVLEFTSLPMLGWLTAAVLPWIIHRWQRQKHQTTPWAAVELLQKAIRQRGRRVKIQQWLLLAIRTAILALLALAVAVPTVRQWALPGASREATHQIIVLDQSYSMGCMHLGSSRWDRALEKARQAITDSDRNALTLIGWSSEAENLLGRPVRDPSLALSALEGVTLSQTSADLSVALHAVLAAIDRAETEMPSTETHHVLFFTDLGRLTWAVDENQRKLIEVVAERADLTIVNVAEGQNDNLAITDVQITPAITLRQRETTITATVACFGNSPSATTTIALLVEGHPIDEQQIDCHKNGKATVNFTHRFVDEGPQTVQVVLANHTDCLPCDDTRWHIVNVRPQLQVACLAGQPNATHDLARALAPNLQRSMQASPISPEVFPISQLSELDLSQYAAVLLGSVSELSPREAATLTEYVRQGGGLALFLGEETTALDELKPLLPVRIKEIQTADSTRFDPLEYRHPIVSPFRGQTQAGLLGVSVSQYWQLQLVEKHSRAEVVLQFDTGDPALVVGRFGLGRVAVSALPGSLAARTSTDTPWSSFALSPSFLPVIRELITHLVGERWTQQRNVLVGEPAVLAWGDGAKASTIRFPDGVQQTLPLLGEEDHRQRVFRETNQCGVYQFNEDGNSLARIAVHLDGRDSDLTLVDLFSLPKGFLVGKTQEGLVHLIAGSDYSLARILLASVLGLLLLETGLAWQLGRGWG